MCPVENLNASTVDISRQLLTRSALYTPSMPSIDHEAILALFRNAPRLVGLLVGRTCGVAVDWSGPVTVADSDLSEVQPVERRADLVLRGPGLSVVVEVQRSRDGGKRLSWPAYVTHERAAAGGLPTMLVVVAMDPSVARWARRPITTGHPGFVLKPLVLGREAIPRITDPDSARAQPELAVLSAMAHGDGPDALAVGRAAVAGLTMVDTSNTSLYFDIVLRAVGSVVRRLLEDPLTIPYTYKSDFAKRYIAIGREEGREEGREQGEARALRRSIRAILDARSLSLSPKHIARLEACTNIHQLDDWLERAVTAPDCHALFDR